MRCLTVRQPWAWALFHGKDVENRRNWRSKPFEGPLLIHAGLHLADQDAFATVVRLGDEPMGMLGAPRCPVELSMGAIIGVVDVVGQHLSGECFTRVRRDGCSPWAEQFVTHLQLANPRLLSRPVECKGSQGLWVPSAEVVRAVKAALR